MTIVTLPTAGEMITGLGAWAGAYFTELLPLIYIPIGLFAVSAILLFLTKQGRGLLARVTRGGKRRFRRA